MSEYDEIRYTAVEYPMEGDTYDYHRNNARLMDDKTLLRNFPHAGDGEGNWSKAMRDEVEYRGLKLP